MTYAKAGVDARHIHETHELLARRLESTFATRKGKVGWPIFPIGHYAGLVDLGQGKVLSLHTDSVGTKVLIAQMMGKYDTIGIDCVAMCANDLICTGTEPISFLDYIAMSRPNRAIVEEVAIGLVKGAKEAGIAIVGGETAIVPELLSEDGGVDLVGFATGFCRKSDRTSWTRRRTRRNASAPRNISTHKISRTRTGHRNVPYVQHGSRFDRNLPRESSRTGNTCVPQAPTRRDTNRTR